MTIGKSSLILDALLVQGNPADSQQVEPLLRRQCQLYGRYPRQASFDGGFASLNNLKWAKEEGVQDVAFAKKCGLTIENMVRSSWVYKQLRRFRAGIEGCISTAKRVFGLSRCLWKGWDPLSALRASFRRELQSGRAGSTPVVEPRAPPASTQSSSEAEVSARSTLSQNPKPFGRMNSKSDTGCFYATLHELTKPPKNRGFRMGTSYGAGNQEVC